MFFKDSLVTGKIIRRYKRFLADIALDTGGEITAYVPNTGSMKECWAPGWKAALMHEIEPGRKLEYTLKMLHNGRTWIGIDTGLTNKLVYEALVNHKIPELSGYSQIIPEFKVEDSRLDFLLKNGIDPDCYTEVKNVTLIGENNRAEFPDAVTSRGQKHLNTLMRCKIKGYRAIMLYVIQREDTEGFSPADTIDPRYAELLGDACRVGVEVLVYQCSLSLSEIKINRKVDSIYIK